MQRLQNVLEFWNKKYIILGSLTCGDTQNIIKNYESYVINWIRPLAIRQVLLTQGLAIACVLVRASSHKLQATSIKLQATSAKLQAPSLLNNKRQASSSKLQAPWNLNPSLNRSLIYLPSKSFMVPGPRAWTKIKVFFGCLSWKLIWCGLKRILFAFVVFS